MNQPVVIVLASGKGERFIASGGTGNKLQALLSGQPVLERTLNAVRASGLAWHLEDAGHAGMGDSIAAAVRATRGASGWLVLPGDLPLIQPASLRLVAAALAHNDIVLPSYQGQRGHPVGFSAACREGLLALSGAQGAASVVRHHSALRPPAQLALDDPGVVTDIDTVQDLAAAQALLTGR